MLGTAEYAAERGVDVARKILENVRQSINTRKAQIVIEAGLGYRPNEEELRRDFPTMIKNKHLDIMEEEGRSAYRSPKLGIWIRGEPERRGDDLYCHITKEKLEFTR
ncbi:MAG: hypothetical protein KJ718_04895 [Nanoarchaeota archaeon]|nr:hypothetical protein [Nanoarchaeota archaeon]MBU1051863.1 hypothetical protein [Nanoarchaeota archaeon]MBU1989001.1 hypothetical protein [Nanoarchaeota archaeon]